MKERESEKLFHLEIYEISLNAYHLLPLEKANNVLQEEIG